MFPLSPDLAVLAQVGEVLLHVRHRHAAAALHGLARARAGGGRGRHAAASGNSYINGVVSADTDATTI